MTYWPAAIQMNNSVGWQKHLFFLLSLTREPFVPAFPQVTFDNFSPISIVSFCLQLWAFIVKSRQYLFLNCSFIFVTFFLGVVLTLKRFLAVFTIFTRCFAFTAIPLHFCFSFRHNAKLLHSRSAIDIKIWNLTLLHLLAPRQTHLCDFCLVTQTLSIGDKIITQCNIGNISLKVDVRIFVVNSTFVGLGWVCTLEVQHRAIPEWLIGVASYTSDERYNKRKPCFTGIKGKTEITSNLLYDALFPLLPFWAKNYSSILKIYTYISQVLVN